MGERLLRLPSPTIPGIADSVRVSAGDLLFVSGVVGAEPDGSQPEDFEREVELVFDALAAALQRGGATLDGVIRVNVYVVDLSPDRLRTYREVRDRRLGTASTPASTLVGVAALVSEAYRIEIDAIAAL